MHPNALLDLASDLLRAVLRFDQPADGVVSAFFRQHRALGPRERHTLAETAYAVLRQRLRAAAPGAKRQRRAGAPAGHPGLAGQRRPSCAARWARTSSSGWPQVHGDRPRHAAREAAPQPARLAGRARCRQQLGDDFWPLVQALDAAGAAGPARQHAQGQARRRAAALAEAGIDAEPTPFSPWGLRVQGKPALNKLDLFTAGAVEVQDEGSQLLALLTDAKRGEMVVDFCAGAGGKTLALGAAMRNTGRLYAFDVSGHRLDALKPRLARSGLSQRLSGADRA